MLLGFAIAGLIWGEVVAVPNRLNFSTPLRVADSANWLTRLKLARLERDDPQCLAVLADSPVAHRSVPIGPVSRAAAYPTRSRFRGHPSFSADDLRRRACHGGLGPVRNECLRPAARQHFGQDVVRVTHLGTYACRNINHSIEGRRSEHATANAIDLAGFVLADGQQITLKDDWSGSNAPFQFLRALRDGACDFSMWCSAPITTRLTAIIFI